MAKKTVNVFIGAKNKMAAGLRSSLKSLKKFNRSAKGTLRSLGQMFRRVGLVAGTAFVGLVKFGNQFRTQMAQVNTMLGDGSTLIPKLTKQVRDLSAEFGVAKKTLTEGLYQALSAGIPAGNAIEFLKVATEAAVGGVTDVKTSVDGLTTVMNAYAISADKARDVSDILFTVVKDGKINYEELSENIGKIAPTAKVAGVGLRDLSAMVATLVKIEKPERAMTALRQSMIFAAKAGKPLLQVLNEFEGASLEDLMKAGVNTKAAAGIALVVSNMKVLRKEMVTFKDTAGAADEAFKKVDAMKHWQKIWQSILSVTTRVGEKIDQTLSPAINTLAEKIRNFGKSEQFDQFIDNVKTATDDVINLIRVLSGGGDSAKSALKGIASIFGAIFKLGGEKIAFILKKVAPEVGMLIAKGMADFAKADATNRGVRSAAKSAVARQVAAEKGISRFAARGSFQGRAGIGTGGLKEWNRRVDEMTVKMIEMNAAAQGRNISTKGLTIAEANLKDKFDALTTSIKPKFNNMDTFEVFKPTVKRTTGNLTGMAGGVLGAGAGGISSDTSMLSASDLFTMMQTGQNAGATVLGEAQKTNQKLDKLIEIGEEGGIE